MRAKRSVLSVIGGLTICLALALPAAASEKPPKPAFDWMANATKVVSEKDRLEEARLALRKARVINANATWVCSPAGFGKRSHCTRG